MKNSYKAALLAALGLAVVASANAGTYTAGDLLVGFTTASGTDLIYDLGQASSLYNGETWSGLSTLLGNDFTSESSLSWGVIGNEANSGTPRTLYTTTVVGTVPATITGNSAFGKENTVATTFAALFSTGATAAGKSATVSASAANSWNMETLNGTLTTQYINAYENPNVVGETSADFSSVLSDGATVTLLGDFTLGANDTFTYTTATTSVPEPTTYGLIAGAGLLIVSLRNKFSRKQA
jgi:hypothetical protein